MSADVLNATPGPAPSLVPGAHGAMSNPLRGRDDEMASLHDHLARLRSGTGTSWLIEGGPGLGKSRLVEQAVSAAREAGRARQFLQLGHLADALATGVGHVVKARAPEVEVICIQPLGAPAMTHSWRQRRVVTTGSASTIADGVAGRRPIPAVLDDLLLVSDDAVLVQEASIIAGMRMLLDHAGLVVEPSAALGIAAILEDPAASPADT
jgi:hypothetical protein